MRKGRKHWLTGLGVTLLCMACGGCSENKELYKDPSQPVEKRVENLMQQMTLQEKVAQMCQYVGLKHMKAAEKNISVEEMEKSHAQGFYKDLHSTEVEKMACEGLIGSFLHVTDLEEANYLQTLAQKSRLKIPLLIGIDAIHGNGLCRGVTVYPTPIGQASTFDVDLVEKASHETAKEMRATGAHWTFTPNIEVARDPRWGRTGETFGEDPYVVTCMGVATVKGLQGPDFSQPDNVIACIKHFVGGSQPVNGVNGAPFDASERTIREVFFPPFKACVDAGAYSLMTAHNEVNGVPAHANKWLMTDVLRNEWGFEGFVVSDWMDIERLHDYHTVAPTMNDAFELSVAAGMDMHMHGPDFMEGIIAAVKEGRISEKRIDESVRKLLTAKFKLGLFENPYYDENQSKTVLFSKEHQATALEMARKSIVLLKNDDLLPLNVKKYKKVFVTGPNASTHVILGDWAVPQPDENIVTIVEGLKTISPETEFSTLDFGWNLRTMSPEKVKEAGLMARKADLAIVVVGENSMREQWGDKTCGENTDRSDINLPGLQEELVETIYNTGVPTVVVLVNGRQLGVEWIAEHVPALVEAWEPGSFGGQAVAEILYGKVNPSGKLPVTVPRSVGQIQSIYNHKFTTGWFPYAIGKSDPLYPFGYGLSYTKYKYDNLKIDKSEIGKDESVKVSVDIANVGEVDGDEIVQLYIRDDYSSATRPVKELKDFRRVTLKKGEIKTVTFDITPDKLAYYDVDMKYGVEPGTFKIMLGTSSRDEDLQSVVLTVK
ncbi:glycoside hydrolase family 3 N-terminal domain-containing protein [Bacteroides sp.]|uniref:glycoside hydrolase family 3 N-terminal domain-containing protein n=1 Tax=Bacteroides sp. TaxID=29523 RepID=UPI00260F8673|nr:glycoside hydrolase family 3 N-terminal domain-containing protein [Bacteroides sp.]